MESRSDPLPTETQELIGALVAEHHAYVRALAVRLAPSPAEGDDVAQEAFLLLMSKRAAFDLTREVRPLLAAIVRNLAKQAWDRAIRDNHQQRDELADYLEQIADQSAAQSPDWDREALDQCLGKLTGRVWAIERLRLADRQPLILEHR